MGVGVYESDFQGLGHTFGVSGPLLVEDDYEQFLKESGADLESVPSFESWSQDQYDQANEELVGAVENACRELGFSIENRQAFRAARAGFDSDFVAIADDGVVAVGWRSWESDFVVGIGPTKAADEKLGYDAAYAVRELGRDPETFRTEYESQASAVEEFVRLSLLKVGLNCRYKTSGYTSAAYVLTDAADARLAELKAEIVAGTAKLTASPSEALALIDASERQKIVKTAVDERMVVVFPVAEIKGDQHRLHLHVVSDDYADGYAVVASMEAPKELYGYFRGQDDGVTAVPRDSRTEGWFASYQTSIRRADLVASADEIVAAIGEAVTVRIYDGSDNSVDVMTLADAPEAGPSPGM